LIYKENSDFKRISFNGKSLSFLAKGFNLSKLANPVYRTSQKCNGTVFTQESYLFEKERTSVIETTLTVSIISLSHQLSGLEQLQCINNWDISLQKISSDYIDEEHDDFSAQIILKPVYRMVQKSNNAKSMVYAFSGLAGNHTAIYFTFTAPNDPSSSQLINEILASTKIENLPNAIAQ
jgi:hypothetical protein